MDRGRAGRRGVEARAEEVTLRACLAPIVGRSAHVGRAVHGWAVHPQIGTPDPAKVAESPRLVHENFEKWVLWPAAPRRIINAESGGAVGGRRPVFFWEAGQ